MLITFALVITLLLMVSALAVDLAGLRVDRRADRLVTDAAAAAAVGALDQFSGGQADLACQAAWEYVLLNLADEGSPSQIPTCSTFASTCQPTIAREETGVAGPYTITLTHPVPDNDPLMAGQDPNPMVDGAACQRFGVRIVRDREYAFAKVAGFDSGATNVRSVAHVGTGTGEGELVPLVVLEPIGCGALYTSGQGRVTVASYLDAPGYIVVDSTGTKVGNPDRCGNGDFTIENQGGLDESWIRALPVVSPDRINSAILSYTLGPEGDPGHAYYAPHLVDGVVWPTCGPGYPGPCPYPPDPALEPPDTWFRLHPEPIPTSRRITRAPIDWRYNCQPSYPDYPLDNGNPGLGGIPIAPCPEAGATPSFIDDIEDFVPSAFQTYEDTPATPCNLPTGFVLPPLVGDWRVNCTGPQGFSTNTDVTFSGGNVFFEGPVNVGAQGSLTINDAPDSDQWVVVRRGLFKKVAQADLIMERTFVYLADGMEAGDTSAIDFGGGTGILLWTAPLGPGNPSVFYEGNYEDLALWSESTRLHNLGGQASTIIAGTLFTPNALFTLSGQASQFQTDAQFLTRRLEVKGDAEVRMSPDPDRVTPIPIREIRLIR
jgi:hypothetical protein